MGLTVPDTVDLLDRLRHQGVDVPLDALSVEGAPTPSRRRFNNLDGKDEQTLKPILQIQHLTHTYGIGTPLPAQRGGGHEL